MKKGCIFKKKRFFSFLKVTTALLIFLILISNNSISVNTKNKKIEEIKNIDTDKLEEIVSDGLAPRHNNYPDIPVLRNSYSSKEKIDDCTTMFGYKAYPSPEKIIYFDTCEPETIEELGDTISDDFLSGGTYGLDGICYAVQYGDGTLYGIDLYSGDMWVIGGGGISMNGLAYDPTNNRLYGSSFDDYLYEIDPDTGEQEMIGAFGNGVEYMIGMSFDSWGVLYGWDLGNDKLWTIDTESGEAKEIGNLGIDINYAQDGDFLRETDELYLTAYTTTGQLYKCDKETGQCELIGNFENGAQITASMFVQYCPWTEHDIALKNIDYPETGRVEPDMKMQITVKNLGHNTETFDAQMQINYNASGNTLIDENFSGDFPPEGWEMDCWEQCWDGDDGYACFNTLCESDDYSITTNPINASEYYNCNLRFRWTGDYYYPQYTSIYVKFRMNETSPWKVVTPWDNPVGENQDGELYEIGIYGSGEPLGEALQIRWEPFGYYYYFNYLFLDDVTLESCINIIEYAELIEDVTLAPGEEIQIEFPDWTPSDWQNESAENTWKEYLVHAFTILDGDQNPRNDEKWKTIDLWYPWMHDIEIMSIDSPHSEGSTLPGQTFPVQVTIRNVGQYAECCIPIDVRIGKPQITKTLLNEKNWSTVPPEGWYDQHNDYDPEWGWRDSDTSYSCGSSPEAYIPYEYCKQDYVFYSYAIDTSEFSRLRLKFKSFINHYSGQGLYTLEAGYSTDRETWYTAWSDNPGYSHAYDVDIPITGGFENTYIGFWIEGNPYYFNNWYIDDVELIAIDFEEEYSDYACQGPDIEPGEEVTLEFEEWTPEFLLEEKTDTFEYIIETEIDCEVDKNPGNDIKSEFFTLDFWHDVGVDEITSPSGPWIKKDGEVVIWVNGEPDGRMGVQGSMYMGYSNIIIDDFSLQDDWIIQGGKIHFVWDSGYASNLENINFYIFEETGNCDPSKEEFPEEGFYFQATEFTEETTGNYYFGRPEIIVDFLLDEQIYLPAGNWYVGIQPDGISEDIAYLLTTENKGCEIEADLPYWGYPRWTSGSNLWGEIYDISFEIHGGWFPFHYPVFIQPGIENIDAIVMNYGTFPKYDLTCFAEIWEYITNPHQGNIVYTDEIGGIDLSTPLGGYEELEFEDFTFAEEGHYELLLNLPASPDDMNRNNNKTLRIHVDGTEPVSGYPPKLNPPDPNGCNGWYVDDVKVTLNATDPWLNGVSSGIKEIRYTLNGGAEQIIPGYYGTFWLTEDGDDILIEYWAIDYVGNVESPKNSFTIDIDQTPPDVSLTYEVVGGNKWHGWDFEFIASATDVMSGIWYIEFYVNEVLQETIYFPDVFIWTYKYYGGLNLTISVVAYDYACNSASDVIIDPTTSCQSFSKNRNFQINKNQLILPR